MTLAEAFEDHLKLVVRFQSGAPLRASGSAAPNASRLASELDTLERREEFNQRTQLDGFNDAQDAVNALIDSIVDQNQKPTMAWIRRNPDPEVGHNFYTRMLAIAAGNSSTRLQLLEVYSLCVLLGFPKDIYGRQERVSRVLEEVSRASAATKFPVGWSQSGFQGPDPDILRAHRRVWKAIKLAFWIFVACAICVYGVRWIGIS